MNIVQTPFNYTGSKHKLLTQIIPLFDRSKPFFMDVFCGGGSVYTNVLSLYDKVWANDVIGDLVGAHKGLLDDSQFLSRVRALVVAKDDQEGYHKLRDAYNAAPSPEGLFALMLCCTNNMMRLTNRSNLIRLLVGALSTTEPKPKLMSSLVMCDRCASVYASPSANLTKLFRPSPRR